jgi:hypothetical protein
MASFMFYQGPRLWFGVSVLTVAVVSLYQAQSSLLAQTSIAESSAGKPKDRVREGTELQDVLGTFRLTGDRATFYPADGTGKFGGLENQTLERVATVIAADPASMEWLVTGTITEFRGNNYILVTRAILKAKPSSLTKPANRIREAK